MCGPRHAVPRPACASRATNGHGSARLRNQLLAPSTFTFTTCPRLSARTPASYPCPQALWQQQGGPPLANLPGGGSVPPALLPGAPRLTVAQEDVEVLAKTGDLTKVRGCASGATRYATVLVVACS